MGVVVLGLRLGEGLPNVKKAVILLILLLLAAAGGLAAWQGGWLSRGPGAPGAVAKKQDGKAESAGSPASSGREVHALGHLEPAGGILTVGALVGDRIQELKVREGAPIQRGETIAILASRALRRLEYQAIRAQIEEAQGRLQAESAAANARIRIAELNLKKAQSSQAEITVQERQVALAEANLELNRTKLTRMENLSAALVSRQELEQQRLLVKKAEAELAAASATLESLRETSQFAEEGAQAELEAAQAAKQQVLNSIAVASLEKQAEAAKKQFQQTIITAPADGTVLRIFTRRRRDHRQQADPADGRLEQSGLRGRSLRRRPPVDRSRPVGGDQQPGIPRAARARQSQPHRRNDLHARVA
jgi:multidrug efflux pump subunit AcrA (membrane-fusion protein)